MKKVIFYISVIMFTISACSCGLYLHAKREVFNLVHIQQTEKYKNAAKTSILEFYSDIIFKSVRFSRKNFITFAFHANSVTPVLQESNRVFIHWNLVGFMTSGATWLEDGSGVGFRRKNKLKK